MKEIEKVFSDLNKVTVDSVVELSKKKEIILEFINYRIKEIIDADNSLIGENCVYTVYIDNHRFFSSLIENLHNDNFDEISETLCEIYKSYDVLEIPFDFLLKIYEITSIALKWYLSKKSYDEIFPFFQKVEENHDKFINISKSVEVDKGGVIGDSEILRKKIIKNLLNGNERDLVQIIQSYISDINSLKCFYIKIIKPSIDKIDQLRMEKKLTEDQETIAAQEIVKIMNYLYVYYKSLEDKQGVYKKYENLRYSCI